MKKIIIASFLALGITSIAKAETYNTTDTIKHIKRADNVTVVKKDGKTVIRAIVPSDQGAGGEIYTYTIAEESTNAYAGLANINSESLLRLPFTRHNKRENVQFKPSRYITGLKYIYWGWNFNYNSKSGIRNCFETGIADVIGIEWSMSHKTTLGLGLGFGMTRATTADKQLFINDGDRLEIIATPTDADVNFARLDIWRFQLPLYWRQRLTHQFGFSLGAIVNFNTYATATNSYTIGRTRYKETIKRLNQRLLTVDLQATVGIVNGIGAYIKWSPMTAMEQIYGPSYRSFSIGVTLNF